MLRSAAASWTLFFGLLLIMAGNGLQVVLLGVEAKDSDFSNVVTGFVMAGYFLGMFFGSILVPKLLNDVGHVRVFGAMSALASAAVLVIALFVNPVVWALMRILTQRPGARLLLHSISAGTALMVRYLGEEGAATPVVQAVRVGSDSRSTACVDGTERRMTAEEEAD